MDAIKTDFGTGVALVIVLTAICLIGGIPGHIARRKRHHHAAAITVLGYIGFFVLGIGWIGALVWALALPSADYDRR